MPFQVGDLVETVTFEGRPTLRGSGWPPGVQCTVIDNEERYDQVERPQVIAIQAHEGTATTLSVRRGQTQYFYIENLRLVKPKEKSISGFAKFLRAQNV